jgi:hypothetical protein
VATLLMVPLYRFYMALLVVLDGKGLTTSTQIPF